MKSKLLKLLSLFIAIMIVIAMTANAFAYVDEYHKYTGYLGCGFAVMDITLVTYSTNAVANIQPDTRYSNITLTTSIVGYYVDRDTGKVVKLSDSASGVDKFIKADIYSTGHGSLYDVSAQYYATHANATPGYATLPN